MRKVCGKCKKEKPSEEFANDKSKKDGRRSVCKKCIQKYMSEYWAANSESLKEKRNKRYANNRTEELEKHKESHKKNGWKWNRNRRNKHRQNPLIMMCQQAKIRATRKGIEFNLSPNDLTIPSMCPVLGIPLFVSSGSVGYNSPTLDRIDNSKGYIPENVIVVSFKANTIKNTASIEELEKVTTFYKGLH